MLQLFVFVLKHSAQSACAVGSSPRFSFTYFLKRDTETRHYGSENLQLFEVGKISSLGSLWSLSITCCQGTVQHFQKSLQCVLHVTDAWSDNQLEELQGGSQLVCVRQDASLYYRTRVSSLG